MTWTPVPEAADLAEGRTCVFEADGKRLLICRTADGFHAIDDLCTHDGGALDQGFLDGTRVECPRHGARFDVITGRAVSLPAVRPVKTYPTRLEGGAVEVDMP